MSWRTDSHGRGVKLDGRGAVMATITHSGNADIPKSAGNAGKARVSDSALKKLLANHRLTCLKQWIGTQVESHAAYTAQGFTIIWYVLHVSLHKQSTEVSNAAMLNPPTPQNHQMDLLLYIYILYILNNNQSCCLFAIIWYISIYIHLLRRTSSHIAESEGPWFSPRVAT